jgi:hypothetical protein
VLPRQPSGEADFSGCATRGEIPFVENIQIDVEPPVRCMRGNASDSLQRRQRWIGSDLFRAPHGHAASDRVDTDLAFVEAAIELCDGRPSDVERAGAQFGGGRFCPWNASIVSIGDN